MRYFIMLFVLFASGLGAQYQIGFENDGLVAVTEVSFHENYTFWSSGNILTSDLLPGQGEIYPWLSAGSYTVVATTEYGIHTGDLNIPSGVVGSVIVRFSNLNAIAGPAPTTGTASKKEDNQESCSTGGTNGKFLFWLLLVCVACVSYSRMKLEAHK